eukprot:4823396-Amphidinium_carterae.1
MSAEPIDSKPFLLLPQHLMVVVVVAVVVVVVDAVIAVVVIVVVVAAAAAEGGSCMKLREWTPFGMWFILPASARATLLERAA